MLEEHNPDEPKNYRRALDLERAVVTVEYDLNGAHIKREYFASYPDNVMVIRICADRPVLDFSCNLMRRPFDGVEQVIAEDTVANERFLRTGRRELYLCYDRSLQWEN